MTRRSSRHGRGETNPTRNHEVADLILALLSGSGIAVSCGVGQRRGSDPTLLWLWRRLAATAPIGPLAWEPPYAARAALKRPKEKKKVTRIRRPWSSLVAQWVGDLALHCCGSGCCCGTGLIPGLGTSTYHSAAKKKRKKKKT